MGDELTVEQWVDGDTVVVSLTREDETGAETVRSYEFADESAADNFQERLETTLVEFGWSFVGHLPGGEATTTAVSGCGTAIAGAGGLTARSFSIDALLTFSQTFTTFQNLSAYPGISATLGQRARSVSGRCKSRPTQIRRPPGASRMRVFVLKSEPHHWHQTCSPVGVRGTPERSPGARLAGIVAGATSVLALAAPAAAQSGANVLVVINSASPASETIGRQYAARRGVPPDNVCAVPLPLTESVGRDLYDAQIEPPIWACIASRQAHDRILYILLTKDVPIRIAGTGGRNGTGASVDSELTLLYRRRTGTPLPIVGFVMNPYFAGAEEAPATVKPFTRRTHDIYLVTRLDGYTVQDALGLLDRASAAAADGRFVLDQRASLLDPIPNRWFDSTAERLKAQGLGDRVVLEKTAMVVSGERAVGYYSWGSNDTASRRRTFDVEFVPGALAGMFVTRMAGRSRSRRRHGCRAATKYCCSPARPIPSWRI